VAAPISVPDAVGGPVAGVTVYRVVQEALTNAYRHGEGAAVVDVRSDGDRIHVSVENRISHMLRGAVAGSGLGLVGMREHAESCGGTLLVSAVDDLFRIDAVLNPAGAQLA